MAPISLRRPLLHDLHLTANDIQDNKNSRQDTWFHSTCANYPLAWDHYRSWQSRQNGYSLLSISGPRPISFSNHLGYK
ncbi:hypothetical protein Hanom_Chr06g00511701 [Helianthus anomalus]